MVRNGLRPSSNIPIPMKGETARLLVTTLIQHLVVFGLGAGAHSLIG